MAQSKCKFPDNPMYFKEQALSEIFTVGEDLLDITKIIDVMVEPSIRNIRLLETDEGVSHEGQIATGYEVLVEVLFKEKILYLGNVSNQPIQGCYFEVPKTFAIVVPRTIDYIPFKEIYNQGLIRVDPYIEKVYGRALDNRTIQVCMLFFLDLVKR
ncbi:MAG: hypothetical protein ACRCW2_07970 [Cellulosilyticaceae bacterium]